MSPPLAERLIYSPYDRTHRCKGLQKSGTPVQRRREVHGVETMAPRFFSTNNMEGFPLSVSEINWTENTGRGQKFSSQILRNHNLSRILSSVEHHSGEWFGSRYCTLVGWTRQYLTGKAEILVGVARSIRKLKRAVDLSAENGVRNIRSSMKHRILRYG